MLCLLLPSFPVPFSCSFIIIRNLRNRIDYIFPITFPHHFNIQLKLSLAAFDKEESKKKKDGFTT